jgi:hypothetical protein
MTTEYVIAVGDQFVSRFTYPESTTKVDKLWERSDGIKVAPCCKAHLGSEPYRWPSRSSPEYVAGVIVGSEVREVPALEKTKGRKK